MTQNYRHILTFWFKHNYFSDSLFRSFELSVAEDSRRIINNLGLIIKPFPGGFYLLTSDPELLGSDENNQPIQFNLNCKDPLLINYTELPSYNLRDNIIYFNNLSTNVETENKSISIHKNKYVSGSDIVQIIQNEIIIPRYDPDKNYQFRDALGNEISSAFISPTTTKPGTFLISGIDPGLVRIFSSGQEIVKFYHNPTSVWKKPICIVELFIGELHKQYQPEKKVDYSISFDNRKTTWKYFLTNEAYLNYTNLSIINKAKDQIFLPPQKQAVHHNISALVFESKTKIPLVEFTEDSFQLVDKYDPVKRSGIPVFKNLPKASSQQLFTDTTESSGNIYSHIYI